MNVKQRMISLKLLKEKKNYSEFLEEIGVTATVRVNSSEKETDEKKYYTRSIPVILKKQICKK